MKRSARKRLLEQWRGVPTPSENRHSAQVVGDVVPDLMKSLGLSDRYAEEEIGRVWTQIVGHPLCLQTVPIQLKHRTLKVRMIQPTIHYVLETMRDELLEKLQAQLGKERIQRLQFVVR